MSPTCWLCGENNKVGRRGEDILPEWTRKELRSVGPFIIDGQDVPLPRRLRTRKVCGECNGWLNSTFENPTKPHLLPLVHGTARRLSGAKSSAVAKWCFKTLLLGTLWKEPTYAPEVYHRFRAQGVPTPGTGIWIGSYHHGAPAHEALATHEPTVPAFRADCHAAAIVIKHLVTLMVMCTDAEMYGAPVNGAEALGMMVRVWPEELAPITWPPPTPVNEDAYRLLGVL